VSLTLGEARRLATALLTDEGLPADRARTTAEAVTLADAWGIGSHGLLRLPYYLDRTAAGGYPAGAQLRTVVDTGPLVVLEGGGGLGHWQLHEGARTAVARAREHGVALVAVGNSGHCGALSVYVLPLVEAGLAGVVLSDGPPAMPAWGGTRLLLSTSPLAAGFPGTERPVVVDMALAAVARGKVAAKAAAGEQLPEGWAYDAEGRPTTDPAAALRGMLAPLGGPKGFALALVVELLTGGLVGPVLSAEVTDIFDASRNAEPQRIAHVVLAIDPARTDSGGDPAAAQRRVDDLARRLTASGGRVPGSGRTLRGALRDDLPLRVDPAVEADLRARAGRVSSRAAPPDR
jgi:(2R)-3-sulfolactate dehydrogenase (NADP+)